MQLFAALGCTAALALSEQPEALRQLAPALLVLAALDLVLLWPAALVSRPEREARHLGPAVLAHASALLPAVAVCARAATYPLVSLLLAAASLLVLAIVARALVHVRRLPPRLLVLLLSLACLLPPTWGALRLVADASWPPAAWGPLAWPALLLTHAPGESRQRTASRTQPPLEATPTA
ncbi:MAG: hypothetical protein D6776_08900, partial [Planctomycetota bacterium]